MGLKGDTDEIHEQKKRNQESVKSIHLCKSVIQTNYDIVKAHGGDLKVETKEANS